METSTIADLFIPPKGLLAPVEERAAKAMVCVDLGCGAALASAAAAHWAAAMAETPEEREKRMERNRREAAQRAAAVEAFTARYHVRPAEKACANCKHCTDLDEGCCTCKHPDLGDGLLFTSANTVCDAWEGTGQP